VRALLKLTKQIAFCLRTKTYNKDQLGSFFAQGLNYSRSQYTPPETINPLREDGYGIFYESTKDSTAGNSKALVPHCSQSERYFIKGGFWNGFIDGPSNARTA
jgi:hypothetical protein